MTDYCDPHIKSDITGFEQAAQEISALLKGEDKLSLEKDRVIKVLKKHQHIRYSENRTAYGVFDIDYESIASELCTGESDNEILFHECPSCNSRCNCSDQPCSCCSTDIKDDKITDAFCKTRDEDITGNLHYRDRDYFQAGYDFGISDKDAIIQKQEWCDFCGELHEGNCSDNAKKRIANLKKQ